MHALLPVSLYLYTPSLSAPPHNLVGILEHVFYHDILMAYALHVVLSPHSACTFVLRTARAFTSMTGHDATGQFGLEASIVLRLFASAPETRTIKSPDRSEPIAGSTRCCQFPHVPASVCTDTRSVHVPSWQLVVKKSKLLCVVLLTAD